jgi:hypothetical protein
MINYYKKGQKVRVSCIFAVNGTPTDPTTITCKVMDPSRNVSTYVFGTGADLVKDSTGVYHVDVVTTRSMNGTSASKARAPAPRWKSRRLEYGRCFRRNTPAPSPFSKTENGEGRVS